MFTVLVILLALAFNVLVYFTAGNFLAVESLGIFLIIIYVIPALLNGVIVATGVMENISFRFLKYILPTLTLIAYIGFSKMMTKSVEWQQFVATNSDNYQAGYGYVQLFQNLLGVSQILFILLFNFAVVMVVKKLMRPVN